MSKAIQFKKWFSEHMGHSPQLKLAHEAIKELEEKLDKSNSALSGVYESGVQLDEHENIVRDALGLTVF